MLSLLDIFNSLFIKHKELYKHCRFFNYSFFFVEKYQFPLSAYLPKSWFSFFKLMTENIFYSVKLA